MPRLWAVQDLDEEMRYAKRVDNNQAQIVKELGQIPGVKVYVLGDPVDLLVGFRARNYLFEIKREDKRGQQSAITDKQKKFIPDWPGQVRIIHNAEEAIRVIQESYQ
jgi:hypothetical protein